MKKTLFAILLAFIVLAGLHSCKKESVHQTVPVEGLFSLTGSWSSLGIASKAALALAADDANSYLDRRGARFRITVSVSDTKLDADLAKSFFSKAKANGTRFVIGPQSSAELAAIKPLADNSEVIVVSQGSTAGSLAIAGDGIFRYCPGDKIEGAAIAATIYKKGIRGLVTLARDDAGNKGLQTATGAAYVKQGGQISAIAPYATSTTNFASVIALLKTELAKLSAIHGVSKVAVYLASFDECTELFKLAGADPALSGVSWFGGDGVVLSTALLADPAVANFAIKTGFFAPSFGLPAAYESKWRPVYERIKALTGIEPDAFALAAYDAVWTIAYTVEASKVSDDHEKIKSLFAQQASLHPGVTGEYVLDAAGDRATGSFDYFGIVKEGNAYKWTLTGKSE